MMVMSNEAARAQALDAGRDPEVVRIETLELDAWLGLPGLRE